MSKQTQTSMGRTLANVYVPTQTSTNTAKSNPIIWSRPCLPNPNMEPVSYKQKPAFVARGRIWWCQIWRSDMDLRFDHGGMPSPWISCQTT